MDLSLNPDFNRSPEAVLLPVLALLAVVLTVPPFAWHLKNRNIAACSLIFWVSLDNVFVFTNALIWPTDDIKNWWDGAGLCDVQIKLNWAASVGASGALASIMRNLAKVMDVDRATFIPSPRQRKRQAIIDLLWCFALPVYVMAVDYVVQSSRYYIFTISGCTPSIDSSWLSIVLIFIWAPLVCVVDSYYCVLVIIRMHKYRKQFSQIVSSSSSNLNKSRFVRLFLISFTLLLIFLPLQFYILYVNLSYPRHPYSWSHVHGPSWSQIVKVPTGGQVIFDRWIRVGSGLLIFVFFGLGKDAMGMYRKWLVKMGLAKVFPSLTSPRSMQQPSGSTSQGALGSLSSRAKLLFTNGSRNATTTTTTTTMGTASMPSPRASISTDTVTPSPSDPQKTFTGSIQMTGQTKVHHWRPFPLQAVRSSSTWRPSPSVWATDTESGRHGVVADIWTGNGPDEAEMDPQGVRVKVDMQQTIDEEK